MEKPKINTLDYKSIILDYIENELLTNIALDDVTNTSPEKMITQLKDLGVEVFNADKIHNSTVNMIDAEEFVKYITFSGAKHVFLWRQLNTTVFAIDGDVDYSISKLFEVTEMNNVDELKEQIVNTVNTYMGAVGSNFIDFEIRDTTGVGYSYKINLQLKRYINIRIKQYVNKLAEESGIEVDKLESTMYQVALLEGLEQLYEYVIKDPEYKLCKNKALRQDYINRESFFKDIGKTPIDELSEDKIGLHAVWFMIHVHRRKASGNSDVYYRYMDFYKKYIPLFENAWAEIKGR